MKSWIIIWIFFFPLVFQMMRCIGTRRVKKASSVHIRKKYMLASYALEMMTIIT